MRGGRACFEFTTAQKVIRGSTVGGEDTLLRGFQVVGGAVVVDDVGFGIEQGEGGTPVAVAGLADGAGVNHVTRIRLQLQRDRLGLPDSAVFGTKAVGTATVGEESALQMRVAEKGERCGVRKERYERVSDGNDIDVFVAGRAVNQLCLREAFEGKRALRQSVQPFVVLWC